MVGHHFRSLAKLEGAADVFHSDLEEAVGLAAIAAVKVRMCQGVAKLQPGGWCAETGPWDRACLEALHDHLRCSEYMAPEDIQDPGHTEM